MNTSGTMRINERKWPVKLFAVLAVVAVAATAILAQLGGTLAAPADKVVTLQCESGVSQDFYVEKGETKTLGISYLSDARSTDTNVATVAFTAAVDGEAGITGVKAGIASLIYGNIAGKVGAFKFQITDSENISGYTLKDGGEMSFDAPASSGQGETKACPVVDVTGQASRIVWSSMNESVATVAANGDITSVGPGMTVVTGDFTDKWGVPRYINIVVGVSGNNNAPSASWDWAPHEKFDVRDTIDSPSVTVLPAGAAQGPLTWTSSRPDVATVDSNGFVSGVSAGGPVTITATAPNGATASYIVNISEFPNGAPSIDEDFEPGVVLVCLKHSYSHVNLYENDTQMRYEIAIQDSLFSEVSDDIGIASIEDLTAMRINDSADHVVNPSIDTRDPESVRRYEEAVTFHQILKITLVNNGKEAVLEAIPKLQELDFVFVASPNHIMSLDWYVYLPIGTPQYVYEYTHVVNDGDIPMGEFYYRRPDSKEPLRPVNFDGVNYYVEDPPGGGVFKKIADDGSLVD